jgi:hypothetical protein
MISMVVTLRSRDSSGKAIAQKILMNCFSKNQQHTIGIAAKLK